MEERVIATSHGIFYNLLEMMPEANFKKITFGIFWYLVPELRLQIKKFLKAILLASERQELKK